MPKGQLSQLAACNMTAMSTAILSFSERRELACAAAKPFAVEGTDFGNFVSWKGSV